MNSFELIPPGDGGSRIVEILAAAARMSRANTSAGQRPNIIRDSSGQVRQIVFSPSAPPAAEPVAPRAWRPGRTLNIHP